MSAGGSPAARRHGTTLLVIAKSPVPGRVKTRLTPPFTPEEAARLAEASLVDTLHAALATSARRRVLVLDGAPGAWLPAGIDVVAQCDGGLDQRLAAAFAGCDGPAVLIGMDTPQVTPALLAPALGPDAWRDCDAWFGPADDGGFWAPGSPSPTRSCCGVCRCRRRTRVRTSARGSRMQGCAYGTCRSCGTSTRPTTPPWWRPPRRTDDSRPNTRG